MPRLPLLALLGLAGLTAAHAQPTVKSYAEPRFFGLTADQILAKEPQSANPYVAFLPAGVTPDYDYWNARLALGAYRRALQRSTFHFQTRGGLTQRYTEHEQATRGLNDTFETAEALPALTAVGPLEIAGDFGPALAPEPDDVTAMAEGPAGKMDAQTLTLDATGPQRLRVTGARIGDGPYGTTSGDVDFYILDVRVPNTHLKVTVDTPEGALDPVLALYTDTGAMVDYNDDSVPGANTDPSSIVFLEQPGRYVLFVYGYTETVQTAFGLQNPRDPGSGFGVGSTGPYVLDVSLAHPEPDVYAIVLQAGDVLALTSPTRGLYDLAVYGPDRALRMRSRADFSFMQPESAPFASPAELDPGNNAVVGKTAIVVAPVTGTYAIVAHGEGGYRIQVLNTRPHLEAVPDGRQTLFVDFDGATIDANALFDEGNAVAMLSPLAAFLARWGLTPADEDAVIDAAMAALRENLLDDLRRDPGHADVNLVFLDSRDDADPFGTPGVSRLIIGGSILQSGIETIGIASSIDPGNYDLEDTAIILLDLLSEAPGDPNSLNQYGVAPGHTKAELVGRAIGNVAAHEAGHFLGLFHTDQYNATPAIQDAGGNLDNTTGIGRDRTFGTADDVDVDFVADAFVPGEFPLQGVEDQASTIAFGLMPARAGTRGGGTFIDRGADPPGVRVFAVRGGAPEAEGYTYDFGDFRVRITGAEGAETLWVLRPGSEVWEQAEPCEVALMLLEAGASVNPAVEGIQGTDSAEAQAAYDRLLRALH